MSIVIHLMVTSEIPHLELNYETTENYFSFSETLIPFLVLLAHMDQDIR